MLKSKEVSLVSSFPDCKMSQANESAEAQVSEEKEQNVEDASPPVAAASQSGSEEQSVEVSIVAGRDLTSVSDETTRVLVSVTPPRGNERQPSDLTCVIDVSGSMSTEATIQSAGGTTE